MKTAKFLFAVVLAAVLVAASCSSSSSDGSSPQPTSSVLEVELPAATVSSSAAPTSTAIPAVESQVVPFENG